MEQRLSKVFKEGVVKEQRRTTQPYSIRVKAKIIREYLKGDKSFGMLGKQYEINPGIISRWVRVAKYGQPVKDKQRKITKFTGMKKKMEKTSEELQEEIKMLKKQLEEEKLKTLIYQKVIEIAERDYNLDIVKKYEARRPGKSGK
jgi:transposase-like protein